jgi:pSer/pThr/pTyr-binding forkhead associated (FHA) protein
MNHSILVELARALSTEEFVARLPEPVLVVMSQLEPDSATGDESTAVGEESIGGIPSGTPPFGEYPQAFETLAVRKKRHAQNRERITLGREKTCDIVVRTPGVSRVHAHFLPGSPLGLLDPGSQNGTFVDGKRVERGQQVTLRAGQEIVFGDLVTRLIMPDELYGLLKSPRS